MSEQPSGEKSFEPTEKRKRDATRKGDVLRSRELATAAAVLAGGAWLFAAGGWLVEALKSVLRAGFTFEKSTLDGFAPVDLAFSAMRDALPPVLTLGLVVLGATLVSQLAVGEGRFLPSNLAPKASRINPLSGFKRMFGTQGLIELGKSLLKIFLLGSLAMWWAQASLPDIIGLGRGTLESQLAAGSNSAGSLFTLLAVGLVIIALIDWPIQFMRRNARLKMTQQEMRDEHKQTEGSPEKKMAQRQRQRDLARGGIAKAMNEAQFVITNPMHFAVALTYDPALAHAPVVLAKGRGEKALAMREMAREQKLPVLEYPALARSVYFTTRENQVVRQELYVAIARLVAFVFSLKRGEHPVRPRVDVPIELRFDADGNLQRA